jgi:hypothetical protein
MSKLRFESSISRIRTLLPFTEVSGSIYSWRTASSMYLCIFIPASVSLQFLKLMTVGMTPWTGDQPVARPLPTQDNTKAQNKSRQTSMPWVGFETTNPVFERAKTAQPLWLAVACIPVAIQWLCKQRPLLGNRFPRRNEVTARCSLRGPWDSCVMKLQENCWNRCFLCGPCRCVISRTSPELGDSRRPVRAWTRKLRRSKPLPNNDWWRHSRLRRRCTYKAQKPLIQIYAVQQDAGI